MNAAQQASSDIAERAYTTMLKHSKHEVRIIDMGVEMTLMCMQCGEAVLTAELPDVGNGKPVPFTLKVGK
jgi:hypothetical protein